MKTMIWNQLTDRSRHVLALACEEANAMGHNYAGTEHLLIALAGKSGGAALHVLKEAGLDEASVRSQIRKLCGA